MTTRHWKELKMLGSDQCYFSCDVSVLVSVSVVKILIFQFSCFTFSVFQFLFQFLLFQFQLFLAANRQRQSCTCIEDTRHNTQRLYYYLLVISYSSVTLYCNEFLLIEIFSVNLKENPIL